MAHKKMVIAVGTGNPQKVKCIKYGIENHFPGVQTDVILKDISSGVPAQPFGREILQGAFNRAKGMQEEVKNKGQYADFCVGMESGIIYVPIIKTYFNGTFTCIINNENEVGWGRSSFYPIPECMMTEINNGKEFGTVFDELVGQNNTKYAGGGVDVLTKNVLDRNTLGYESVSMAMTYFKNNEMFKQRNMHGHIERENNVPIYQYRKAIECPWNLDTHVILPTNSSMKLNAVAFAFSLYALNLEVKNISPIEERGTPFDDDLFKMAELRRQFASTETITSEEAVNLKTRIEIGIKIGVQTYDDVSKDDGSKLYFSTTVVSTQHCMNYKLGHAISAGLQLPVGIVSKLKNGVEFWPELDKLSNGDNIKEQMEEMGYFTDGTIDRKTTLINSVIFSLLPHINPLLYGARKTFNQVQKDYVKRKQIIQIGTSSVKVDEQKKMIRQKQIRKNEYSKYLELMHTHYGLFKCISDRTSIITT